MKTLSLHELLLQDVIPHVVSVGVGDVPFNSTGY